MWVYCITESGQEEVGPCKIGIATHPSKRLSSLQGGNWRILCFAWKLDVPDRQSALWIEQYVLGSLRPSMYGVDARKKLSSEWVEASPMRAMEIAKRLLDAMSSDAEEAA